MKCLGVMLALIAASMLAGCTVTTSASTTADLGRGPAISGR
jgi:ABC-type uncharacterized transport system auxiliary subunit